MKSLERQLHFWLALSLIILMAIVWMTGNLAIRHLTENFAASRLEHDGESLIAALDFSRGSDARLRWRRLNQVYNQPYSGHYYIIRIENEAPPLYSRSLWDSALEIPALAIGESRRLHLDGPLDQKLLVWVKGFQKQGVGFTLAIAEDLTAISEQQNHFQKYFAILALAGLAGLLAVQRLVVRRAVQKLGAVREEIKRLADGETGNLSEDVPLEILPLVQEFNHLLLLLSRRVSRSRNALGNLAHALKGPLSFLVQYFDDQPSISNSKQDIQARNQLERIEKLMERELKRARLVGKGISGQRFDSQQELPDLIGLLRQIHARRNLSIEYSVENSVPQFGDREDMLELIGNLLDNACKWAASAVSCTVSNREEIYRIIIEDDGEGLSTSRLEDLVKRGVRLDESTEGHGLGLAIVKDIADLYDGNIEFSRSEDLGGLKVTVSFPR
jgi:signal transduction histidine kinase